MNIQTPVSAMPDFAAIKSRQQMAWASGDYAVVGTTLQIVGEMLCEAVDLRSNQRVLDVAAGNGNATLAAARRFAEVVSTDYVGSLLERGRQRAEAERLPITFREADAEKLPFEDAHAGAEVDSLAERLADDLQRGADDGVVARRPGHLLTALDGGEIGHGGHGSLDVHDWVLSLLNDVWDVE